MHTIFRGYSDPLQLLAITPGAGRVIVYFYGAAQIELHKLRGVERREELPNRTLQHSGIQDSICACLMFFRQDDPTLVSLG
jgi:hypothetical protein